MFACYITALVSSFLQTELIRQPLSYFELQHTFDSTETQTHTYNYTTLHCIQFSPLFFFPYCYTTSLFFFYSALYIYIDLFLLSSFFSLFLFLFLCLFVFLRFLHRLVVCPYKKRVPNQKYTHIHAT